MAPAVDVSLGHVAEGHGCQDGSDPTVQIRLALADPHDQSALHQHQQHSQSVTGPKSLEGLNHLQGRSPRGAEEPPMLQVAAAVIQDGAKMLIARRRPGKSHAGYWEFPGGKIEPGETNQSALRREIYEELSVKIDVGDLVARVHNQKVELWAFRATVVEGQLALRDHDQMAWLEKGEVEELLMTDLDRGVLRAL